MAQKISLAKEDLHDLAEDIFAVISPCWEQSNAFREAEKMVTDIRDDCCGDSDSITCKRSMRTFQNVVDIGIRGMPGAFKKPIAERLSRELDKIQVAWRKELVAPPKVIEITGAFPEEIEREVVPDCAESDYLLDGMEKFLRWNSQLVFAECVSERGLLR